MFPNSIIQYGSQTPGVQNEGYSSSLPQKSLQPPFYNKISQSILELEESISNIEKKKIGIVTTENYLNSFAQSQDSFLQILRYLHINTENFLKMCGIFVTVEQLESIADSSDIGSKWVKWLNPLSQTIVSSFSWLILTKMKYNIQSLKIQCQELSNKREEILNDSNLIDNRIGEDLLNRIDTVVKELECIQLNLYQDREARKSIASSKFKKVFIKGSVCALELVEVSKKIASKTLKGSFRIVSEISNIFEAKKIHHLQKIWIEELSSSGSVFIDPGHVTISDTEEHTLLENQKAALKLLNVEWDEFLATLKTCESMTAVRKLLKVNKIKIETPDLFEDWQKLIEMSNGDVQLSPFLHQLKIIFTNKTRDQFLKPFIGPRVFLGADELDAILKKREVLHRERVIKCREEIYQKIKAYNEDPDLKGDLLSLSEELKSLHVDLDSLSLIFSKDYECLMEFLGLLKNSDDNPLVNNSTAQIELDLVDFLSSNHEVSCDEEYSYSIDSSLDTNSSLDTSSDDEYISDSDLKDFIIIDNEDPLLNYSETNRIKIGILLRKNSHICELKKTKQSIDNEHKVLKTLRDQKVNNNLLDERKNLETDLSSYIVTSIKVDKKIKKNEGELKSLLNDAKNSFNVGNLILDELANQLIEHQDTVLALEQQAIRQALISKNKAERKTFIFHQALSCLKIGFSIVQIAVAYPLAQISLLVSMVDVLTMELTKHRFLGGGWLSLAFPDLSLKLFEIAIYMAIELPFKKYQRPHEYSLKAYKDSLEIYYHEFMMNVHSAMALLEKMVLFLRLQTIERLAEVLYKPHQENVLIDEKPKIQVDRYARIKDKLQTKHDGRLSAINALRKDLEHLSLMDKILQINPSASGKDLETDPFDSFDKFFQDECFNKEYFDFQSHPFTAFLKKNVGSNRTSFTADADNKTFKDDINRMFTHLA